jgi:hypothetical protein
VKRPEAVLLNRWGRRIGFRKVNPGDVVQDIVVDRKHYVLTNCVIQADYSTNLLYYALPSQSEQPSKEDEREMRDTAALRLFNNAGALEHTHMWRRVDRQRLPGLVAWEQRLFLLRVHCPDEGTYQEITPVVLDR